MSHGSKHAHKAALKLRSDLLQAQLALHQANIPVLIIITGVDGAGKGELVHRVTEWLHPRWVETQAFWKISDEERERPLFWRFWRVLPARGCISVFLSSWYTDPIIRRATREWSKAKFEKALQRICRLEKTLTDDGMLIIKLALYLSKKDQHKRLKQLEEDPRSHWRIFPPNWKHHKMYDQFVLTAEKLMRHTHSRSAPWFVIDAADPVVRDLQSGRILLRQFQRHLRRAANGPAAKPRPRRRSTRPILDQVDLSQALHKQEYEDLLARYQWRLNRLSWQANEQQIATVAVFEGWDAAGKGSSMRRVTQALDPRLYRVIPIAAPNDEERAHHYLWRFWRQVPRAGNIALFDRSWYGRVLVERIEGFASTAEWMRAYDEINDFEEQLAEYGVVVVKFWIHIDKEEQLRRFRARAQTPHKRYKITDEDWRNRDKWSDYEQAVNDMIERTHTPHAPWTVVAGNDKRFARVQILKTLCSNLEHALE